MVETRCPMGRGEVPQRTLVLIKPDNFRFATGRPGNVIDFLSRTGLYIVGIKVHRMSVAQAAEFYGPVREVLRTKLKDVVASRAKAVGKGIRLQDSRGGQKTTGRNSRAPFWRQSIRQHRQIHVRPLAGGMRSRANDRSRARKSASRWFTKGVEAIAKFATCWARPIPPRRRPARSGANLARTSWSTPPTPAIPWKAPSGKWASSTWAKTTSAPWSKNLREDRMAETGVIPPDARVELLDGRIIDMSPIGPLHGGVVNRLNPLFNRYSRDRWLLAVQDPVHLEDHSEPQPDLMLLKPAVDDYDSRHPKPEDVFLLIEVSDSTLETDREVKAANLWTSRHCGSLDRGLG
jgi:hypothetical protein